MCPTLEALMDKEIVLFKMLQESNQPNAEAYGKAEAKWNVILEAIRNRFNYKGELRHYKVL